MKNGRLQAKDIPTRPILEHLAKNEGAWHMMFLDCEFSIWPAIPPEVESDKLVLAKMRSLIDKGLVDGCACGCRGDFHITAAGLDYLSATE
jgi:hypothetical protein